MMKNKNIIISLSILLFIVLLIMGIVFNLDAKKAKDDKKTVKVSITKSPGNSVNIEDKKPTVKPSISPIVSATPVQVSATPEIIEHKKIKLTEIKYDLINYDDSVVLTPAQRTKYSKLVEAVKKRQVEISLSSSYDENLIYGMLIQKSPLSFLIKRIRYVNNYRIINISYVYNKSQHDNAIKYVTNEYINLLNDIIYEDYNQVEKVLVIYRYFSDRINYNYDWYEYMKKSGNYYDYPEIKIYEALKNNYGVCHTYTYLMQLALHQFGFETINMVADVVGEENEAHSWLRVKIGNEFYNFDVTWESEESNKQAKESGLKYFGMTDEERNSQKKFSWIDNNIQIKCNNKRFQSLHNIYNWSFSKDHTIKTLDWSDNIKYIDTDKL